jgi:hypothetical protein
MANKMNLGFSDLPFIYNITLPVGQNMPNMRDDVMLVQILMKLANFTRNSLGMGPIEASRNIKVDGYFGDQTKRMIGAFEIYVRERKRLIIADGVFEPSSDDGYTGKGVLYKIIHLNRFAKESSPFGNDFNNLPEDSNTPQILRQALLQRGARPSRLMTI